MKLFAAAVLLVGFALPVRAAESAAPSSDVSFRTIDGLTLAATWHAPAPGKGVIVMLHGLDSSMGEWTPFAAAAQAAGWGTLAYDARGHGRSVRGAAKDFRSFGAAGPGSPWARMTDDLDAAVRFVNMKGVKTSSVCVVGASLGANVAAQYAARGGDVRALVLMSPGLNYAEFRPDADFDRVRAPRLIIVSEADRYAFASSQKLALLAPGTELWSDVQPGHGVQMFDVKGVLAQRLLKWIETTPK